MFTITRGGINSKHPKTFFIERPEGLYCYIILLVKSAAQFRIGKESFTVSPNTAFILHPGIPYRYSGLDCEYKNDWIYFDCSDMDFDERYGYLMNHPIPLNNPMQLSQYFQHIIWERDYGMEAYRADNISMLFQILLNKLIQEHTAFTLPENNNPYAAKLQDLRLTMQSQPDKNFTPEELSYMLNVSPSHFQFLYKKFFGVPFKTDLIHMRLDYARELITDTGLSFEQIAFMSGYSNEVHFYRQFKAKTGMTPQEYRNSMYLNSSD